MSEYLPASPFSGSSRAVQPLGHFGRAVLRCPPTMVDIVGKRLGIALPQQACRAAIEGKLAALWLGPDEWLLLTDDAGDEWVAELQTRLGDALCALVDVSHRQVALAVRGPQAEMILASGCALDLSPAAFPEGMCTRTMYDKAEIVLWRVAADAFHVEVWRSFARYVEELLRVAEVEA